MNFCLKFLNQNNKLNFICDSTFGNIRLKAMDVFTFLLLSSKSKTSDSISTSFSPVFPRCDLRQKDLTIFFYNWKPFPAQRRRRKLFWWVFLAQFISIIFALTHTDVDRLFSAYESLNLNILFGKNIFCVAR